jgi:hypothetical protein
MAKETVSRFGILLASRIVICLAFITLLLSGYMFYPAIRARYLVYEFTRLQLDTSFDDAEKLAKKLNAKQDPISSPCDRSYCIWRVDISNSFFPKWWRRNDITLEFNFTVKDSMVTEKGVGYQIGLPGFSSAGISSVYVAENKSWQKNGQKWWRMNSTKSKPDSATFVVEMARPTPEDRKKYTTFNYSCFWKYKGCRDTRDLLPTADPFPDDK